ncbi:DNA-formamidopyrimidine glycosylase [Mycoplasmatota bacterium]|nr:DNA-formamidopyrimidine glycosylase [Mycoplasmatota bacterium]
MPELPEVETVRQTLRKKIINKKITSIDVLYNKIIKTDINTFQTELVNQTIREIDRFGKYLLIRFDDYYLVSHFRMEGKYLLRRNEDEVEKHSHIIFHFSDQTELRYNDVRKFGTMHLKNINEVYLGEPLAKLGLEPFDSQFNLNYLQKKLNNKRTIKSSLLDQTILVGLGNIYVNEVLFLAKIHPEKLSYTLNNDEIKRIIQSTISVLKKAIALGGSTIRSYYSDDNITGRFQNELFVHLRKEEPCLVCGNKVRKIKVAGRGTYYCPVCQKK